MDIAVKALTTKAELGFAEQFATVKGSLPGADSAWARSLREEAMRAFTGQGLPHRRIEEWKYTDLRAYLADAFAPARPLAVALTAGEINKALGEKLGKVDSYRLVMIDGQFRPELSSINELGRAVEIISLADALVSPPAWFKSAFGKVNTPERDPLVALNTALMSGGVVLRIRDGAQLEKPVHIVHVRTCKDQVSLSNRHFIAVGNKAQATIIESFVTTSPSAAQRFAATELDIGTGADVRHLEYQCENNAAFHLSTWMVRIGTEAKYRVLQLATGAALARNQLFVRFAGEDSTALINAARLARGRQHGDTTLVVDHAVPGCLSRELFKTVLDGRARAVFQGKVTVQPGAQKTDGKQMAQALLLSEDAEFDSKPELEIFADDVVCGHGSTSGQIDADLMFYLRARGIPEPEAQQLLILAFIGESLEIVEDEALRDALSAAVESWLGAR